MSIWDRLYDLTGWIIRNQKMPDHYRNSKSNDMNDHQTFADFFATLGIKNFTASEFTSYFHVHRRGVTNSEPPREMWGNIVKTIRIVDQLRDHFGKPVVLLSSYRSPAYNRAIGDAAPKSYHMQFMALDIAVAGKSPRQVFDQLADWRVSGKFTGGIGLYNSFVHIDTRGYDATWGA